MPRPNEAGENRLIVALDVIEEKDAVRLVDALDGVVSFYKINAMLFCSSWGMGFLEERLSRHRVFVDLKLGDIGATIRGSVEQICNINRDGHGTVRFLTLGPSAGADTYAAAARGRGDGRVPEILGIPVLSSIDEEGFRQLLGRSFDRDDLLRYADARARTALASGCDGLIASGELIARFRDEHPDAVIVSPGIRSSDAPVDDHKRTRSPEEAIRDGADYLVVGRPITGSPDPAAAAGKILEEMDRGLRARAAGDARSGAQSA